MTKEGTRYIVLGTICPMLTRISGTITRAVYKGENDTFIVVVECNTTMRHEKGEKD